MNINRPSFWAVQIAGWTLFTVANLLLQEYPTYKFGWIVIDIWVGIAGLAITSLFWVFIRRMRWKELPLPQLFFLILLSSAVVPAFWSGIFTVPAQFMAKYFGAGEIPFWRFFMGVYLNGTIIVLAWTAIYFGYQYFSQYSHNEVEKWKLQAALRDAELENLRAQVQPHFLFNTLNNIRALILEDPQAARIMLTHLSDLLRYSLAVSAGDKATLQDEIAITRDFLALMTIQYEDRLATSIEIADDLQNALLPSMLIQMLVENAIKHGVSKRPEGGTVRIRVTRQKDLLEILVANEGTIAANVKEGDHLGVGSVNIQSRLALQYNGNAGLEVTQKQQWVQARVWLPLEIKEEIIAIR